VSDYIKNRNKMKLSPENINYINRSVLCWLATSFNDNIPNVSPKEIFTHYNDDKIIIANIASPQSLKNIEQNENVCVSFIDILIQKEFQIKGKARIVHSSDEEYASMEKVLTEMTGGHFPFASITEISVEKVKPIIAPRYLLYPDTTEENQIRSAKKTYGLNE